MLLWAPTGLYGRNRNLNFPFLFTSHWLAAGHAMGDASEVLREVPPDGAELGLWWGRSAQVMRGWDSGEVSKLDPANAEHVEAAFAARRRLAKAAGGSAKNMQPKRENMASCDCGSNACVAAIPACAS